MKQRRKKKSHRFWLDLLVLSIVLAAGYFGYDVYEGDFLSQIAESSGSAGQESQQQYITSQLASWTYTGQAYVNVEDGLADFSDTELEEALVSYESYSQLDSLGRCGQAMASVSLETMPTEARQSISSIKPTGWVQKEYDSSVISTRNLYNRCHLIGFQLTGENANKLNLITGTRYMNETMIPFENMIADFIKETGEGYHVLYRVTPVFSGQELVARGVRLEAYSVEDQGESVNFDVWCFNVQPGIVIAYETGDSWLEES